MVFNVYSSMLKAGKKTINTIISSYFRCENISLFTLAALKNHPPWTYILGIITTTG